MIYILRFVYNFSRIGGAKRKKKTRSSVLEQAPLEAGRDVCRVKRLKKDGS